MKKKIYKLDDAGRVAAAKVVREWTDIAFSTGRATPDEIERIKDCVTDLYTVSGLTPPPRHRIVIAPSPFVARFAAGAAAWIWNCRKNDAATSAATSAATDAATYDATDAATYAATRVATDAATDAATRDATYAATSDATEAATSDATDAATLVATLVATRVATSDATEAATLTATYAATLAATRDATYAATDVATLAATLAATRDATYAATDAATRVATIAATDAATRDATYAATDAATRDATYAATYAATRDATYAATDDATLASTRDATDAATRVATSAATRDATLAATLVATSDATYAATDAATLVATDAATRDATDAATRDATSDATDAATDDATDAATSDALIAGCAKAVLALAGKGGLDCAQKAWSMYQGGNMWAGSVAFIAFGRDHVGLKLNYKKYEPWEALARISGFRFLHPGFCIVSERPVFVSLDADGRAHCTDGPYMRWADGTGLFAWHGVVIPESWTRGEIPSPADALLWKNMEQRRVLCEQIGWAKILDGLSARIIDTDEDPEIGELIEADLPDNGPQRFLRVRCGTGRDFVIAVPPKMQTALAANAWTWDLKPVEYRPEIRT